MRTRREPAGILGVVDLRVRPVLAALDAFDVLAPNGIGGEPDQALAAIFFRSAPAPFLHVGAVAAIVSPSTGRWKCVRPAEPFVPHCDEHDQRQHHERAPKTGRRSPEAPVYASPESPFRSR